ncbi:MAG: lipopolysaccharide heptosyltransferase II [bacterium]|nr:lipopolysaccharide heptosyltransferase II [bacterium]
MGRKILIIKPSSMGDIIHALPVLATLRKHYPKAEIAWIVKNKFSGLLAENPDLTDVIPFDNNSFLQLINILRKKKFDVALDLQGLFRSGILAYFSKASRRIGFSKINSRELSHIFYNHKVTPPQKAVHVVDKNLSLLEPLGISEYIYDFKIPISAQDLRFAKDFFTSEKLVPKRDKIIMLNPGAGWPTKRWPAENFPRLADKLTKDSSANSNANAKVIISWGPQEKGLIENIKSNENNRIAIMPQSTIKQLAAIIKSCDLFVGSDTGPTHLAAALEVPVVGLYGPSDPKRNGPYGTKNIIIQKDIPCASCWKRKCDRIDCMKNISVDEVFEACMKLLVTK